MKNTATRRKITFLCLTLLGHAFAAQCASAAQTARQQVYQRAVSAAASDIQRVAQQKNWPDYQSKSNVFIPTEASRFRACSRPLAVSLPQGELPDLARLRYDIRCEGENGWEVAVTVKPDIYLPVLVAKNTVERGKRLAASDVEIKKRNIVGLRDGFITDPNDALGHAVKKRLRNGQPVTLSQLEQPVLVERGQHVLMIAEKNGVEAKMLGEALKKGRKGDMIKVKNLSSQRTVTARVADIGMVRMLVAP